MKTFKLNQKRIRTVNKLKKYWLTYLMFIPVLIIIILFTVLPMISNIRLSFLDFSGGNIKNAKPVKFENYKYFFNEPNFKMYLKNTFVLNLMILVIGFPLAILMAILIFEARSTKIKNFTQTATFLPFFISSVVVTGILRQMMLPNGLFVHIFGKGLEYFYSKPNGFRWSYTIMDIWQTLGYNILIYYAALTAIDPTLYEAAEIDGAGKIRKMFNITIPGIIPTIIITLLLRIGRIMQLGAEKVLLLQETRNITTSEILGTYAYNISLNPSYGAANYGVAAVSGLFDAFVAVTLIIISNKIAKKVSETSLW